MGRITVALLRKRAEHNEGCLSDLKEIALHQQEIERLEVIGDVCRELEIVYLCNNYIPRIEGLRHLKFLSYLNLAVNNIKLIEGLEGCEQLKKLDLTLNFIPDPTSTERLRANTFLETLHLTGNPCTTVPGYRAYVIKALPQLKELDGSEVVRSEQIVARQDAEATAENATDAQMRAAHDERVREEMIAQGIDPFPPKFNEKGERVYGHSAEERILMHEETKREEEERNNRPKDPTSISAIHEELNKKPKPMTVEEEIAKYGRVLMKNEGKLPYRMEEEKDTVVLHVSPGKFITTASIDLDVQPTYVRIVVKGKVLQLTTPEEIAPDKVSVQRATTSGDLKLTMPLAAHVIAERKAKAAKRAGWTDADDIDE